MCESKSFTEVGDTAQSPQNKTPAVIGGVFLTTITGLSLLFGFGMTVMMTKKKDPTMFTKSLIGSRELPESGGTLALKALGWGTLYSVTGVGLLSFLVWKLLGVNNAKELQEKMKRKFPQIPKNDPPGRSEFGSVREFVEFLISEDKKEESNSKT